MARPAGELAQKLLAKNVKLNDKIAYYQDKITKHERQIADNQRKVAQLMAEERKARKYKVE